MKSERKLRRILVTAGPTREMLDPVRFLSNLSTGEMGYALARAAARRGYQTTLISGPTALRPPAGVRFHAITSAAELRRKCTALFETTDCLIMTAAVCDFTASGFHRQKIQRTRTRQLHLKRTPDIVGGLARRKGARLVIGFCLETHHWLEAASRKRIRKNLDGIVANVYDAGHDPFGKGPVKMGFLDDTGQTIHRARSKGVIACRLLDWAQQLYEAKHPAGMPVKSKKGANRA